MSSALRALADAPDEAFESPETYVPEGEQVTAHEPAAKEKPASPEREPEAIGETPGEKIEQPQKPEVKQPKQVSKYELAKQKQEREQKEQARQAKAWQKIEAEKQRLAQEAAQIEEQKRSAEVKSNPARNLLSQGVTPERMLEEAKRLRDNFDEPNAVAAERLAAEMREIQTREQSERGSRDQEQEALRAGPGTQAFDNWAAQLKPGEDGSPERAKFNDAWFRYENWLIAQEEASTDHDAREVIEQFKDPKSEFGQAITAFLKNTALGQGLLKHSAGMLVAYDITKNQYLANKYKAENTKLKQEVAKLRGATSIGGGSPSGARGGVNGQKAFADMTLAEKRTYLRSKIAD